MAELSPARRCRQGTRGAGPQRGELLAPSQGQQALGRWEKPHLCFSPTHGRALEQDDHGSDEHSLAGCCHPGHKR